MPKNLFSGTPDTDQSVLYTLQMLLFKEKFRIAIMNGTKTTTLRSWKRNLVKSDTIRMTNLKIPLFIESVEQISLDAITDAHAIADGFVDRTALMTELNTIYNDLPDMLTLVKFRLPQDSDL